MSKRHLAGQVLATIALILGMTAVSGESSQAASPAPLSFTSTPTPTNTPTNTPTPTPTDTPTNTPGAPTDTPVPPPTNTPGAAAEVTPVGTITLPFTGQATPSYGMVLASAVLLLVLGVLWGWRSARQP